MDESLTLPSLSMSLTRLRNLLGPGLTIDDDGLERVVIKSKKWREEQALRGLPGLRVLVEFECNAWLLTLLTFHGKTLEHCSMALAEDLSLDPACLPQWLSDLEALNICSGAYSVSSIDCISVDVKDVLIETFGDDVVVRSRFCAFQTRDETCDQCLNLVKSRDENVQQVLHFKQDEPDIPKTIVKKEPEMTEYGEVGELDTEDDLELVSDLQLPPKLSVTKVKLQRLEDEAEMMGHDLSRVVIKSIASNDLQEEVDYGDLSGFDWSSIDFRPEKRKRGRPRKYPDLREYVEEPKRKRGRPKKYVMDVPTDSKPKKGPGRPRKFFFDLDDDGYVERKSTRDHPKQTYKEGSDDGDEKEEETEVKAEISDDSEESSDAPVKKPKDDDWCPDNEERLILKRYQQKPVLDGKPAFKCDECSQIFKSLYYLRKHQRECLDQDFTEQRNVTSCPICLFKPMNVGGFNRHVQFHADKMDLSIPVQCPQCKMEFSDCKELNPHFQNEHDKSKGVCIKCYKIMDKANLPRHTQLHHYEEAKYLCTLCGQSFVFPYQLRDHMRQHDGKSSKKKKEYKQETFICDRCGKVCTTKNGLKKHVECVHTEGVFPCEKCAKIFKCEARLKQHMEVHEEEKRFFCPYCDYRTRRKTNVQLHARKMHGKRLKIFQVGGDPRFDPKNIERLDGQAPTVHSKEHQDQQQHLQQEEEQYLQEQQVQPPLNVPSIASEVILG